MYPFRQPVDSQRRMHFAVSAVPCSAAFHIVLPVVSSFSFRQNFDRSNVCRLSSSDICYLRATLMRFARWRIGKVSFCFDSWIAGRSVTVVWSPDQMRPFLPAHRKAIIFVPPPGAARSANSGVSSENCGGNIAAIDGSICRIVSQVHLRCSAPSPPTIPIALGLKAIAPYIPCPAFEFSLFRNPGVPKQLLQSNSIQNSAAFSFKTK